MTELTEIEQAATERGVGIMLFRWLPAITAIGAAIATIVVALISYSASRTATDKDYVALAMNILSDKSSSVPSRRWAVAIVSRLSPVEIPPELAAGLATGRSVLPSELDPNATRETIMTCFKPVLESSMAKPVPVPELPEGKDGVKGWMMFAVKDSGQLEKANNRITGLTEVIDICVRRPMETKP
ncbi:hypothetical protein [Novosphingobium sp. AP12]|uniref:hypothetical protein n=1 Tax=Novosphingobium sp. AP12 TaxID=1144305 RepID=UPI000272101E|nr:hypothetical protein [Novosphingobium sp. AP12]EJL25294.1 hypothetical protein PMI02_03246 [Novosphingobium sp. AP12]